MDIETTENKEKEYLTGWGWFKTPRKVHCWECSKDILRGEVRLEIDYRDQFSRKSKKYCKECGLKILKDSANDCRLMINEVE